MAVKMRNPDAPASSRQLYKLRSLGVDYEDDITMQEASDLIEDKQLEALPDVVDDNVVIEEEPFTEAHVRIVEGDQRSGKSVYAVATIRDSYDKDCVKVFCEKILKIKCEPISYDRQYRVAKIRHNGEIKLIRIPRSYRMHSPMRIFSRLHLYGMPYVYVPSYMLMLKWLKNGFIKNGWLLADEAHRGMSARGSMTAMGREWMGEYFEFGKSRLDVIIITHHARMVDYLARTVPTKRVHCTYNEKTKEVTYTVKEKGVSGSKEVTFYAPLYWMNYKTNEKINN